MAPQNCPGYPSRVFVFSHSSIAGWAHTKLVVTLAGLMSVFLGLYWFTSESTYSAEVSSEVRNLRRLVASLEKTYRADTYAELTVNKAVLDKVIPGRMLSPMGYPVQSVWGTNVDLRPHSVRSPADGFSVLYQKVPPIDCEGLAMTMGEDVHDLKVNGQSVMGPEGPEKALVQAQCASDQGAPMEFVFHSDLIPGTAMPKK